MSQKIPTYFLSHGGGPWPWMLEGSGGAFDELNRSLQEIPRNLPSRPLALLVITAHWIERDFVVSSHPNPGMVYDYGGFPPHTYEIKYPAPGSPALAAEVHSLLEKAGLPCSVDGQRGFDHGTFTTAYPMFPKADVPVVQLSIQRGYSPESHWRVGRALAPLRSEGILILGSGLSYHNLAKFGVKAKEASPVFDRWLCGVMMAESERRRTKLMDWTKAPAAREAHPVEDHLIPLMVALGAAEDEPARIVYHEDAFLGGVAVSSFQIGH